MKKIIIVTSNKHKFNEMQAILKDFDIELEQRNIEYAEDKEASMAEVASQAAKELAEQLKQPVITEDTGLFFKAYHNFPGAQPKFVFNAIGYDGIFRLLKDKDRRAYFKTVIGYCEPGKDPVTFEGEMHGILIEQVILPEMDVMPYDRIFIPDGLDKTNVELTLEEKNAISQRGRATKQLGEYLKTL